MYVLEDMCDWHTCTPKQKLFAAFKSEREKKTDTWSLVITAELRQIITLG
jgi:hypothetical protein